jgi:uncharacterized protein RhaS with RHS repeats
MGTSREAKREAIAYYYRARYYDPTNGRFQSEDPIAFAGGRNSYRFVRNSPIGLLPLLFCSRLSEGTEGNNRAAGRTVPQF